MWIGISESWTGFIRAEHFLFVTEHAAKRAKTPTKLQEALLDPGRKIQKREEVEVPTHRAMVGK